MRSDLRNIPVRRGGAIFAALAIGTGIIVAVPSAAIGADETQVVGAQWGDAKADRRALDAAGKRAATVDPGSLYAVTSVIGARSVWKQKDAVGQAITGLGVTVAVLDSGVAAVPGLDTAGKIVRGPDLSLETNSAQTLGFDTFGHGTHLAGIVGANDQAGAVRKNGALDATDLTKEFGVAPDAQLLALKLAATDGSADVSQVIAALDWVTQHRADPGMNVRVVNLSFGTASVQPYELDPLAAAAEHAWRSGLVVVVAGGNGGPGAGGLTDPAIDPYVIAVGASDANGTVAGWKSPSVAAFSSRGTSQRHVDLVAPGRSIVSLRAPGSFVDVSYPAGIVAGDVSARLFRGSGTSQAAAVVSGAAALVLQANPALTPDQVKATLVRTARPLAGAAAVDAGAGQLDVSAAVKAVSAKKTAVAPAVQVWPVATGLGSLDAARGGSYLVDPETGAVLSGEVDVVGTPWDAAAWSLASASGTSWQGGLWMGARWSGDGWTSRGWATARWSGSTWSRARWSDTSWDTARWSTARWSTARWSTARWSTARWTSAAWR